MKQFILVLVFGTIIGTLSLLSYLLSPIMPTSKSSVDFVIKRGDSTTIIGSNLHKAGLIRSPLSFRLAVYLEKLSGKIQAGEYSLSPALSSRQIANILTRGVSDRVITIPEGYRLEQIAETVEKKLNIPAKDFLLAAHGQEGYLFPDTYAFATNTTAEEVVGKLSSTWQQKTADLNPATNDVILASIIERETLTDSEKGIVAGILKKRLSEGWALEVDATIQYIIGKNGGWWPVPLLGDRKINSPYNTYLNRGLPPAPICNPGIASLTATIHPMSSPYYFYLHDKSGAIHYATTNEEHLKNIEKYIR